MDSESIVSIHASSREDATRDRRVFSRTAMFQSTRPRGRTRHMRQKTFGEHCPFQSTRPRGRTRQPELSPFSSGLLFQSTRPRGRTRLPRSAFDRSHGYSFNPRVLAGGRDRHFQQSTALDQFQSTRPRGRTRHPVCCFRGLHCVSIHASSREDATPVSSSNEPTQCFNPRVLAGGRDSCAYVARYIMKVSIHASSREDATLTCAGLTCAMRFNPRVLAGGRDSVIYCDTVQEYVSIHASSREDATIANMRLRSHLLFQSTRPRGRTRL